MSAALGCILVTGANGQLGRLLIARGAASSGTRLRALVRSERAADQVRSTPGGERVDLEIVDYHDLDAMCEACRGATSVVHLVGILKEGRNARYRDAHERSCEVLARAASAAGVVRIVYLSIFGARPDSPNPCLASKGRAERILLDSAIDTTVLRVPMVLGRDDPASRSLRAQARARVLPLFGGGATLQQPIDARDVIAAVFAALSIDPPIAGAIDLGGPECLTHRALVERAAALHGRRPTMIPLPLPLVRGAIGLLERLSSEPPITRAMFDVLQHDDRVDSENACKRLQIELTPLDDTLHACVGPEART